MENELKITYVGSNYYSGDNYRKIESLLGKDEKYKHMVCTLYMENVPVFIACLLRSNVLGGYVATLDKKKNFASVEEAAIFKKWTGIIEDECNSLNANLKDEKEKILKEDESLLYGKFDLETLVYSASIYDIAKLSYILDNYKNKEISNIVDNKKEVYVNNMNEKLKQTGVVNSRVLDMLDEKYKGNIPSSLDYTYVLDSYLAIDKPTCIKNNGILTDLWYSDMEKIKYSCPNAINYSVIKKNKIDNKAKVKTLK